MGRIFPEHWRRFAAFLPEGERSELLASYSARLTIRSGRSSSGGARLERPTKGACSTLLPEVEMRRPRPPRQTGAVARAHGMPLLREQRIHAGGGAAAGRNGAGDIPGIIVHGRYDMVLSRRVGFLLRDAWSGATLSVIPDAGHSAWEPGIRSAWLPPPNRSGARDALPSRDDSELRWLRGRFAAGSGPATGDGRRRLPAATGTLWTTTARWRPRRCWCPSIDRPED